MTNEIGILDIHVVYGIALRTHDRMGSHWFGKTGILHLAMALEDFSVYKKCMRLRYGSGWIFTLAFKQ